MKKRLLVLVAIAALVVSCGEEEEVIIIKKKRQPNYKAIHEKNKQLAEKRETERKKTVDQAPTVTIGQPATVGAVQFTPLKIEQRRIALPKGGGIGMAEMAKQDFLVMTCELKNTSKSERQKIKPFAVTLSKCEIVDNTGDRYSEIHTLDIATREKERKSPDYQILGQEKMTTLLITQAPFSPKAKDFVWTVYFSKNVNNEQGIVKVKFDRGDIRKVEGPPPEEE